jgi:hypothetical protein
MRPTACFDIQIAGYMFVASLLSSDVKELLFPKMSWMNQKKGMIE